MLRGKFVVFNFLFANKTFRMVNKTKNATNDICLIARSEIIEQVAKQPFRKFMQVNSHLPPSHVEILTI